jgi:hypothetical protein
LNIVQNSLEINFVPPVYGKSDEKATKEPTGAGSLSVVELLCMVGPSKPKSTVQVTLTAWTVLIKRLH